MRDTLSGTTTWCHHMAVTMLSLFLAVLAFFAAAEAGQPGVLSAIGWRPCKLLDVLEWIRVDGFGKWPICITFLSLRTRRVSP